MEQQKSNSWHIVDALVRLAYVDPIKVSSRQHLAT
jgi:hypothetical protein